MRSARGDQGQSTVELVAILPALVLAVAAVLQAILLGQALWYSGGAARAAARAAVVGADPAAAAHGSLPRALARHTSVSSSADGTATVTIGVPALIGGGRLTTIDARAAMPGQR